MTNPLHTGPQSSGKARQNPVIHSALATLVDVALIDAKTAAAAGSMGVSWWHEKVATGVAPPPAFRAPRCTRWLVVDVIEFWREFARTGGRGPEVVEQAKRASIRARIAQALFKSWFVDFDPVRAKQQGLAPAGMDEATAALFPGGFEESALGLAPTGWKARALDEVATYLNGLALQKFPPSDDSWLPVIKIAQLRKGDTVGADRAGRNLKPEYIIQNGDVLFSWSGSLEVEVWCGGEGALNQHLFKVTSKDFPKWFYLYWTRHHLDHFRQIAASKATTMGHIQRAHLSEAKVLVPPAALLGAMDAYFAPILARVLQNELQAQTLATLRDTLLPRLISGQLRLPEVKAHLQAA